MDWKYPSSESQQGMVSQVHQIFSSLVNVGQPTIPILTLSLMDDLGFLILLLSGVR